MALPPLTKESGEVVTTSKCKGNLTVLRRIEREQSKDPWIGQTTNNILRITVPSLLVPSLPSIGIHVRVP
jgi:hypothetical protein